MKTTASIALVLLLAAGCTPLTADTEFGVAQKKSWDKLIANPGAPHATDRVEGVAGVTAEEIMSVHNQTFADKPQEVQVFQFDLKGAGQ